MILDYWISRRAVRVRLMMATATATTTAMMMMKRAIRAHLGPAGADGGRARLPVPLGWLPDRAGAL
jgi:hypothetical protein